MQLPTLENSIGVRFASLVSSPRQLALTPITYTGISPFAISGRAAHTSQLTRADRDLLRDGDQRYQGPLFAHGYREFIAQGLSPDQVDTLMDPGSVRQKMFFRTHFLPEPYDILDHVSIDKNRRRSGTMPKNAHSSNDSAPSSTSNTAQTVESPGTTS